MDNIPLDYIPDLKDAAVQPVFGISYNYNPLIQCVRNIITKTIIHPEMTVDEYYIMKQKYIDKHGVRASYSLKITAFRDLINLPKINDMKDLPREIHRMKIIINDYIFM